MIDKRFTFKRQSSSEPDTTNETETKTEPAKAKKTISWVELIVIVCCGVFFLFAMTSRILFEYRTDDNSNLEVVVGSCTFKNNELIKYDGSEADVVIPDYYEIDGEKYGITSIAYRVFYGNSNIKSITMPDQIVKIGLFAFRECKN